MRAPEGAIWTFTGRWFWPLDPRPQDVCVEDIAHALANVGRFTGHARRFYSVGEHSLNVSRLVSRENALAGLLHDASEAYIADVSSPVKHAEAFAVYRDIEARLERTVLEAFGLPPELPEEIHRVDQQLGKLEAHLLFKVPPTWAGPKPDMPGAAVVPLPPGVAESLFLDRFKELTR